MSNSNEDALANTDNKGQVAFDDEFVLNTIRIVAKHNCSIIHELNQKKIEYFKSRLSSLGLNPLEFVIVIINADDAIGGQIAEFLMPNENFQRIRDAGEVPFARGLVEKAGMIELLEPFDLEAANKLKQAKNCSVVVVDYNVAEIFTA